MSRLLRLLVAFLRLGAGDADPPADPPADPAPDAGAEPEGGDLDSLLALDTVDAAPDAPRETPDPAAEASARADRAERELQVEREVNQRLSQRQPQPQAPNSDPQYRAEEEQLAEARRRGMTENDIGWLQFRIDTQRRARASEQNSAAALREARDVADMTKFNQMAITDPKLHKKYAAKVEQFVAGAKSRGEAMPPREVVLALLAGQDVIANRGKNPPAAKPAPTVDRGRLPPTRTDISGRASASERQKRIERLKGVNI